MSKPKILKFSIHPSWNAQEHAVFVWAPDDWDDMTVDERDEFERAEIGQWVAEEIETNVQAFADLAAVNAHQSKVWGGRSVDSEHEIENWYDSKP